MKKALTTSKPEIINSDQGFHFTSGDYIELLKNNGVKISMDGKGRATDNAITERFFRSLKWEKIYCEEYRKPREVYRAVRDYIDEYNLVRPQRKEGADVKEKGDKSRLIHILDYAREILEWLSGIISRIPARIHL